MLMNSESTQRFSHTVDNYIRFRPGYPEEIISFMQQEFGLSYSSVIADIGSGTGKLTELFLKNGCPTFAVEPNDAMREAGEKLLGHYSNFTSINGTAEQTNLMDHAVDFVTAGQAFHWFDVSKSRAELIRILKPNGWALLIWNKRMDERSAFMESYNTFLHQYSTDLEKINLRRINKEQFLAFYGNSDYRLKTFEHYQTFDFAGVKGRYLSCSYAYSENHPGYRGAIEALASLVEDHNKSGVIKMWYRTEIYYGRLS